MIRDFLSECTESPSCSSNDSRWGCCNSPQTMKACTTLLVHLVMQQHACKRRDTAKHSSTGPFASCCKIDNPPPPPPPHHQRARAVDSVDGPVSGEAAGAGGAAGSARLHPGSGGCGGRTPRTPPPRPPPPCCRTGLSVCLSGHSSFVRFRRPHERPSKLVQSSDDYTSILARLGFPNLATKLVTLA